MARQPQRSFVLEPGEGTKFRARGSDLVLKALASDGAGRFSLMERTVPPGNRLPPAHRHLANDEAYYVLDGEFTFVFEGVEHVAGPRSWTFVPGGVSHTFGNRSGADATLLVIHAPALDGYFAELHELWAGPEEPSVDEERALMRRHGMDPD